jgi:hypothetical protein
VTAHVCVRAACGVCGGQSSTGADFFPSTSVSLANHPTNFAMVIITWGWQNRPLVDAVPSGPNWTPPPLYQLKKKVLPQHLPGGTKENDKNVSQDG